MCSVRDERPVISDSNIDNIKTSSPVKHKELAPKSVLTYDADDIQMTAGRSGTQYSTKYRFYKKDNPNFRRRSAGELEPPAFFR